ncbi:MAG: TPM domain-containing protein [Pyrinomonadaceae bacterium]
MTKGRTLSTVRFVFAAVVFCAGVVCAFSQDSPLPPPNGHVNDYAGVIDSATKQSLEEKLRAFKTSSGVEIAVAVVKTTGDRDIFDYSLAVARGWKIGSKADDNPGALLFIAIDDRKYFTHVSRDLEDELPDGIAGSLQRQNLVPEFRTGNYGKGIADTVNAYIKTIETRSSGITEAQPVGGTSDEGGSPLYSLFCCLVVILVIALIIWSNRGGGGKSRRDQDRWGGGFGGGGSVLPWIIAGGSGGSSSDSSSSWGSGGSDWGGFGGGGDFGGGGAGGGW